MKVASGQWLYTVETYIDLQSVLTKMENWTNSEKAIFMEKWDGTESYFQRFLVAELVNV